ncbi:putative CAAX prenyl protease 2 [Helianthus annuus]|nr:putative CAAX prenyl protease 2 [Helianthus annuus]KAJ0958661.1 putative CAAX prenyl protease 2 [Helianthus annuus]
MQQNTSLLKASMVVGFQLGYTVIFGSYASFLFVRTGLVSVGFVVGAISFVYLLFPLTSPALYNDRTDKCECWHTYCYWT